MTMSDPPGGALLVERRGSAAILTINRPHVRNAVDLHVARALGNALAEADADPDVRAVIVTGAGDKAFCAGGDLNAIEGSGDYVHPDHPEWRFAGFVAHRVGKPVIAAVNGAAIGGGAEIVLACDLVIAAENAVFAFPEVKNGMIAAAGAAFRLPGVLPRVIATELMLTGDRVDARRALDLHLVNSVVPVGHALSAAMEVAERIAANAPLAVLAHLRLARGEEADGSRPHEEDGWRRVDAEWGRLRNTADALEGPRAFLERRPPVWESAR